VTLSDLWGSSRLFRFLNETMLNLDHLKINGTTSLGERRPRLQLNADEDLSKSLLHCLLVSNTWSLSADCLILEPTGTEKGTLEGLE
jgi:hypothetical protein